MISFRVQSLEDVSSTNDEIKRALEAGEPEGLAVRARRQLAGYGRQGRAWASPRGGLYCSLLLRPKVAPAVLPTLSLATGMAVRRALADLAPAAAQAIKVKWPNDVVVEDGATQDPSAFRKLCGISLEAHAGGVCVGCGVNVLPLDGRADVGGKNQPAYLVDYAPHLAGMSDAQALACVSDALLAAFAPLYDTWTREGFAPLLDEFNAHAALAGCSVRVVNLAGEPFAQGVVARVDEFGRLVLRDASGAEIPVSSGEAHIA